MKISLHTFGCKLNQAESDELKNDLIKADFDIVPTESGEDVAIVRGCAVTLGASRSTREMIRRLKRSGAYVVAVGCLENSDLPEIDFVGKDNDEIIRHVLTLPMGLPRRFAPRNDKTNRTRAFIKIQSGCNFNCNYCIIPSFRGKNTCEPTQKILNKILEAEKNGFKEIILTGVNICQYSDSPLTPSDSPLVRGRNLTDLLKMILRETNIPRVRLGSLDPRLITKDLIKIYAENSNRLMPCWHLSLQSGSDEVLKAMNRHYTAKQYLNIIEEVRKNNPTFSFTTDMIVGFPGETEKDFEDTCNLVEKVQFTKVHVFPFSVRPGTQAEKMDDKITNEVIKIRAKKLFEIAKLTSRKFLKKLNGQTRPVLFENKKDAVKASNVWSGYTPEYVRVNFRSDECLQNKICDVVVNEDNVDRDSSLSLA